MCLLLTSWSSVFQFFPFQGHCRGKCLYLHLKQSPLLHHKVNNLEILEVLPTGKFLSHSFVLHLHTELTDPQIKLGLFFYQDGTLQGMRAAGTSIVDDVESGIPAHSVYLCSLILFRLNPRCTITFGPVQLYDLMDPIEPSLE